MMWKLILCESIRLANAIGSREVQLNFISLLIDKDFRDNLHN